MRHTLHPLLIFSFSLAASAAVPLRWTVETSRATPAVFEAYQGETLAFEAAMQSDGKPLEAPFSYALYWQTNGMGSAYWSAPCTPVAATTNVLFATWSPTNDVGACAYNCFIGAPGTIYHAAFQLRLRPSPGATPNALPLPQPVIDFDKVTVLNPPWSAGGEYLPLSGGTLTGDLNLLNEDVSHQAPKITVGSEAHNGLTTVDETGIGQSCARGPGFDRGFRIENDGGTVKIKKIGWSSDEDAEFTLPDSGGCLVTDTQTAPIRDAADNALSYASGVYQFMNASTNAWFEGTNYNVNAEQAASKVKYVPEPWENVLYTPCSLQLYEIRDGERKCVWDQRDWTVYYWNFKSAQLSNDLSAATAALSASVESNFMRRGWSRYTAVNGLDNPNPATLFVDTEKISLMAGMQWEKMIELSGHAYYTITGNGITISTNEASSTFLTIKDFEGNACLTFRKTSSYMVYCECGSEITGNLTDDQGRVCFRLNTEACPTAEFSTILEDTSFVEQGESGCPADYEWTGSAGAWVCHFLLKPGIVSQTCFARFKVMREGENVVEHTVPIKLSGGIVFEQDGHTYKIRPTVVGSTVSWTLVQ